MDLGPHFFIVLVLAVALSNSQDPAEPEVSAKAEDDIVYIRPNSHPDVYFADHFDEETDFQKRWIKSKAMKAGVEQTIAKYDGEWALEKAQKDPLNGDLGLVMKSKAKHAAISAPLGKAFKFDEKPLVVQYELNFQNGQECGGGYIKLLSAQKDLDLRQFTDATPYTIMFGPDKCGSESKLHFIFRHVNPKNATIEEKHCKKLETKDRGVLEECFKDKRPHLYRLVINPDNSFVMSIDYKIVNFGTLVEHFEPPVNPPAEIDDPNDFKPEDWDEREKIPDPSAVKPEDWDESQPRQILDELAEMPDGWLEDEPENIPDPDADKPDDWDEDMDGEWEAPLIPNPLCQSAPGCGEWKRPQIDNPLYKGKWFPPLINNPNYKGKWKPKKVPNPDYFHDPLPFRMTSIGGIGIELWSMSNDLYFDNVIITDNTEIADEWARDTFDLKVQKLDVNDAGTFKRILNYSNRNPWLYAVYVVVVGLPLVLIITFCCSGSKPAPSALPKHPKKTDEVQEDDQGEEEGEVEEVEEEDDGDEEANEEDAEVSDDEVELIPEASETKKSSPRRRKVRKD